MFPFNYETNITGTLHGSNIEKKSWNCCTSKMFKQLLENTRYTINNCEINIILSWSKICVVTYKTTKDAYSDPDLAVAAVNNLKNATFKAKDTKLFLQ